MSHVNAQSGQPQHFLALLNCDLTYQVNKSAVPRLRT